MIILGFDPGTSRIGYAVLENRGHKIYLREAGLLGGDTNKGPYSLAKIHENTLVLLKRWRPEAVAIERLFFYKNQKSALAVAEARGVLVLTTTLAGLKVYEYTPLEVKKIVTGDGRADKTQVQKMIRLTLGLEKNLKGPDDITDAVAIALTHYFQKGRWHKNKRSNQISLLQ